MRCQRCCRLQILFSRFHSQAPRAQTSQRPAAQRSSASQERPHGVLVPPASQVPPRKQTLALGSCLTWDNFNGEELSVKRSVWGTKRLAEKLAPGSSGLGGVANEPENEASRASIPVVKQLAEARA